VNEDAILVDEEAGLFLLADGMSGPRAGGVASRMAVRKAHSFLKERLAKVQDDDILPLLNRAIMHAHECVQQASIKRRLLSGMGTTLIILCIRGDKGHVSHVGDSRAYHLRKKLEVITNDHTFESGVDQDVMLRELFFFRKARVLSQALGPSKKIVCDGHRLELQQGDIILLCSDGLTDMLSAPAIEELIGFHKDDMEKASDVLVESANRMGGVDNISLMLIRM
jgi:protein phosphatase